MAIVASSGKFDFNFTTKIIELQIAYTSATMQELYDAQHDLSAQILFMVAQEIATASGKDDVDVTTGLATGITLRLVNGWRLTAAARAGPGTTLISFTGGNLVTSEALGPDPNIPVAPNTNIFITYSSAVSATIQNITKLDTLEAVALGRWVVDEGANTLTLYNLDNTILRVFDLYESDGVTPTVVNPFERRPQ